MDKKISKYYWLNPDFNATFYNETFPSNLFLKQDCVKFASIEKNLGKVLGEGTGGIVYDYHDVDYKNKKVIKFETLFTVVDKNGEVVPATRVFDNEIHILKHLQQCNSTIVPKFYDAFDCYDEEYDEYNRVLIMEKVIGTTLYDYLLSHPLTLSLTNKIKNAIDILHACKVTHDDLHAENILITSFGEVKIIDFGNSRILGEQINYHKQNLVFGRIPEEINFNFDYMNIYLSLIYQVGIKDKNNLVKDILLSGREIPRSWFRDDFEKYLKSFKKTKIDYIINDLDTYWTYTTNTDDYIETLPKKYFIKEDCKSFNEIQSKIGKLIGFGISGEVHEYNDNDNNESKIIKINYEVPKYVDEGDLISFNPANRVFDNEVTVLKHLSHCNSKVAPKFYDAFDCFNGIDYEFARVIVMEKISGITLQKYVMSQPLKVSLLIKIRDAIESLHQCNVTHDDLHSENIIVVNNGESVKIIDFGNSRILGEPTNTLKNNMISKVPKDIDFNFDFAILYLSLVYQNGINDNNKLLFNILLQGRNMPDFWFTDHFLKFYKDAEKTRFPFIVNDLIKPIQPTHSIKVLSTIPSPQQTIGLPSIISNKLKHLPVYQVNESPIINDKIYNCKHKIYKKYKKSSKKSSKRKCKLTQNKKKNRK